MRGERGHDRAGGAFVSPEPGGDTLPIPERRNRNTRKAGRCAVSACTAVLSPRSGNARPPMFFPAHERTCGPTMSPVPVATQRAVDRARPRRPCHNDMVPAYHTGTFFQNETFVKVTRFWSLCGKGDGAKRAAVPPRAHRRLAFGGILRVSTRAIARTRRGPASWLPGTPFGYRRRAECRGGTGDARRGHARPPARCPRGRCQFARTGAPPPAITIRT